MIVAQNSMIVAHMIVAQDDMIVAQDNRTAAQDNMIVVPYMYQGRREGEMGSGGTAAAVEEGRTGCTAARIHTEQQLKGSGGRSRAKASSAGAAVAAATSSSSSSLAEVAHPAVLAGLSPSPLLPDPCASLQPFPRLWSDYILFSPSCAAPLAPRLPLD